MPSVRKAVVVSIAAFGLLAAAERPAHAQEKSQFALCLQLSNTGVKYYLNFVSQGNAVLINGRQGPIGFQETVGVLSGSILTSSLFSGPTCTARPGASASRAAPRSSGSPSSSSAASLSLLAPCCS